MREGEREIWVVNYNHKLIISPFTLHLIGFGVLTSIKHGSLQISNNCSHGITSGWNPKIDNT
jgi:hypothetical protein